MGTKIDLYQLTKEIRKLEYHQKLYRVLRDELTALGFWRQKERGDAKKGYRLGWGKHKSQND